MPEVMQSAVNEAVDRLNRVEVVARRFDVGRSQIYALIRTGQLRSLKVGGSRRIPESAIQDFIASGCAPS